MNILFLDLETTGLDENKHAVIEIACRLDVDGKKISSHNTKFYNPQTNTDMAALKVNKARLAKLMSHKQEVAEVASFVDWVLDASDKVKGPIMLCGHNVPFDIKFLTALLAKYGVHGFDLVAGGKDLLDTRIIAQGLILAGKLKVEGKFNLENLAKALGIDTSGMELHTASVDVELTAQVLYKLIKLMKG